MAYDDAMFTGKFAADDQECAAIERSRWRCHARRITRESAMEMRQVRYFLAVAEEQNFRRASEQCNVTQPSLARAIMVLEDELGGLLFHRERESTPD
ncbi:MAG: LysR family transcriptional regulator [Alphaproteobacteria bacterium]|nr:LysR family transcriptional regulator [Alphaproteobacteria bacterium]